MIMRCGCDVDVSALLFHGNILTIYGADEICETRTLLRPSRATR